MKQPSGEEKTSQQKSLQLIPQDSTQHFMGLLIMTIKEMILMTEVVSSMLHTKLQR